VERQFHYSMFIAAQPKSKEAVVRYLADIGKGKGIGKGRSRQLWDAFGTDAVRVLREDPEKAAKSVKGWKVEDAVIVSQRLEERYHVEESLIDLMGLLDSRGFPKLTAKECIDIWGNEATRIVRNNPYVLMRFRGCGFKKCDKMWLELGLPPARLKRQALCAWYELASDNNGHTWYPRVLAERGIKQNIAGAKLRIDDAINLARRARAIATIQTTNGHGPIDPDGKTTWVAEGKAADDERLVALFVGRSLLEEAKWPSEFDGISEHQAENVKLATQGTIGLLGGSPGTGKTYTAAEIIRAILSQGLGKVGIAAPTGKAAVRISEAMHDAGLGLKARTLHSLLNRFSENDPIPYRYLVVDESSMIDTSLMAWLFLCRGRGTHILFVGDVNQLPPVGCGAPFRDFINAGLPYGELKEIKRNDGGIVQACADIRDGKQFEVSTSVCRPETNFQIIEADTPASQKRELEDKLHQLAGDPTLNDVVWDTQVVCAVNEKSELSRKELNKMLQASLNHNPGQRGTLFRPGDKIVNTINGYYPLVENTHIDRDEVVTNKDGDVYVANGEQAEVIEVHEKYTLAKLSNPERTVRIYRGQRDNDEQGTGCAWDLAYAISVHKSQGSEWPVVIIMLDEYPGARMVCSREWIYTAISRAKQLCILIGKLSTAYRFAKVPRLAERKTLLKERIQRDQCERIVAEL